ncbi:MAG: IS21 family transposase [Saccharofermentanales bacterium]
MTQYREILRMHSRGISQRSIEKTLQCSRHTTSRVITRASELELKWPPPDDLTEDRLAELLFPAKPQASEHEPPDVERIHREMRKAGVTLTLLWSEYCEGCRAAQKKPLMYTQYCEHYRRYLQKTKATMHLPRKPGEQVEVDWAGHTAHLTDPDTGEQVDAYLFVAALSYSRCGYAEAFLSQDKDSWINAHVHLFQFLGGVPRIVVPDNLKTGVTKVSWHLSEIQKDYQDLANHYDTVILPARVRKPKDKPSAEGTVGNFEIWILAAIRDLKFFSLEELNRAIREKLDNYNKRNFQKKEGSRHDLFLEEQAYLLPLPKTPYELSNWKVATVQFNYHIAVDGMFYSVPFEYIKQKISVKVTQNTIAAFSGQTRICTHQRIFGRTGQYSTVPVHMPPDHQKYLEWDGDRFLKWATSIGPCTHSVVAAILDHFKVKQLGYRSCMGLLKLSERHSEKRLEAACQRALSFSQTPSYKVVQTILKTDQDLALAEKEPEATTLHAFTRGASHYGRMSHE